MRDEHGRGGGGRETDRDSERERVAVRVLHEEPSFDQDEGLDGVDKIVADSFPASDPPQPR